MPLTDVKEAKNPIM